MPRMSALITYGAAALFFLLGVRVGRHWSGIVLGALALVAVGLSLAARLEYQHAEHDVGFVMLSMFFAIVCFVSGFALAGPMIFEKWLPALALSVALIVSIQLLATPSMITCVVVGSCE
jgi:hypothetical protein